MLGFVTEVSMKAAWYALYQTYCGLHYLYYGHQPTPQEQINTKLDSIEKENHQLTNEIEDLKRLIVERNRPRSNSF
jgi:hypothetical protein